MKDAIDELEKNKYLHRNFTYKSIIDLDSKTVDCYLSKLNGETVYSVAFTRGKYLQEVWHADGGRLSDKLPVKMKFTDEMYDRFKNNE